MSFRHRSLVGLLVALMTLPACTEESTHPLRVGMLLWPPYEAAYLARERGHLDPSRVDLVEFDSPSDLTAAFRLGGIDAISVTADFAVDLAQSIPDVRIFFVIDSSDGGDKVVARSSIAGPSDLVGRRVGVEVSPMGAHMLHGVLRAGELDRSEVELVSVDVDDHVHAFTEEDVDALVTYEPYAQRTLQRDGFHVIFDSSEMEGEIVDVLVARRSTLDARTAAIAHLVDGWLAAVESYRQDPAGFVAYGAEREKVEEDDFRRMLEGIEMYGAEENRRMLVDEPEAMVGVLRQAEEILREYGIVRDPVDVESLPDGRFFRESTR